MWLRLGTCAQHLLDVGEVLATDHRRMTAVMLLARPWIDQNACIEGIAEKSGHRLLTERPTLSSEYSKRCQVTLDLREGICPGGQFLPCLLEAPKQGLIGNIWCIFLLPFGRRGSVTERWPPRKNSFLKLPPHSLHRSHRADIVIE